MQVTRADDREFPHAVWSPSTARPALIRAARWPAACSVSPRIMGSGRHHTRDGRTAGFTLVELMITVAIIGVLALLATVGYARWLRTSKTAEATSMLGAIKGAQETFRAEYLRYLDVSAGSLDAMYPTSTPTDSKVAWNPAACAGTPVCNGFMQLNVHADSQVYYRYSTVAFPATGAPAAVDGRTFSTMANDPWFVARARGDLNGDGVMSSYWTSSFSTTIVSEKPGD